MNQSNTTEGNLLNGCYTRFGKLWLNPGGRSLIVGGLALSSVTNTVLNFLVIFLLLITKQLTNVTLKIFFMQTLSDFVQGFLSEPLVVIVILRYYNSIYSCSIQLISYYLLSVTAKVSGFLICLNTVDRYARFSLQLKYKLWVTPERLLKAAYCTIIFGIVTTFSLVIAALADLPLLSNIHNFITFPIVVATAITYILTLKSIKKRRSRTTCIQGSNLERRVAAVSSLTTLSAILFYTPFLVLYIPHGLSNEWMRFFQILPTYNGTVNATIFLIYNKQSRRWLSCTFRLRCICSNHSDTFQK